MGGSYYDREVYSAPAPPPPPPAPARNNRNHHNDHKHNDRKHHEEKHEIKEPAPAQAEFSAASSEVFEKQKSLHPDLDPKESKTCEAVDPIVVALDMTGSMGTWSKIVFDKLPMFFGQLMLQGYVDDPSISFAAIGDAEAGQLVPLEVTPFAQGRDLDDQMKKVWLAKSTSHGYTQHILYGAGNTYESYDLAAYYYAYKCQCTGLPPGRKALFFVTGDESPFATVRASHIRAHIDPDYHGGDIPLSQVFDKLNEQFEVFFVRRPCDSTFYSQNYNLNDLNERIRADWEAVVPPDHTLMLHEPKAIVDLMLGVIALARGTRTLETYIDDMRSRGQTEERIACVSQALAPYVQSLSRR
eukprot:TRINITY_DN5056_c0_g1_i1.p1 TRINITY_DN5056_c0_g1~~TRINITY_DN5056_c0_g1_i1.p1  ORF type:complete len:379 (-),score=113.36 TRINITY_DN5056_c0_g1_i1:70-1137(-)